MVEQDKKQNSDDRNEITNSPSRSDQEIIDDIKKLDISSDKKQDIIATMEMYSGPIPHPKILAGYQALDPEAAKKIIDNGIEESKHRRELESKRQKRRGRLSWAALIFLFIFMIVFILCSFILILKGHKISGTIFAGTAFLVFASTMYEGVLQLSDNSDRKSDETKSSK